MGLHILCEEAANPFHWAHSPCFSPPPHPRPGKQLRLDAALMLPSITRRPERVPLTVLKTKITFMSFLSCGSEDRWWRGPLCSEVTRRGGCAPLGVSAPRFRPQTNAPFLPSPEAGPPRRLLWTPPIPGGASAARGPGHLPGLGGGPRGRQARLPPTSWRPLSRLGVPGGWEERELSRLLFWKLLEEAVSRAGAQTPEKHVPRGQPLTGPSGGRWMGT